MDRLLVETATFKAIYQNELYGTKRTMLLRDTAEEVASVGARRPVCFVHRNAFQFFPWKESAN